jgi:hypothetical protein
MKKILVMLAVTLTAYTFGQNENAKNIGVFVEKTYTDLGKTLDFKATLVESKNLTNSSVEKYLVLESKGFASSDVKSVEMDKATVNDLINSIKNLKSKYLGTQLQNSTEISITNNHGLELGAIFTYEKPTAGTTTTKKEKYYIETKEKYYEGKIVNRDGTGSYIWKEVSVTSAGKENPGKWSAFIRINNFSSKTMYAISVEDLDAFLKFLEENVSKL